MNITANSEDMRSSAKALKDASTKLNDSTRDLDGLQVTTDLYEGQLAEQVNPILDEIPSDFNLLAEELNANGDYLENFANKVDDFFAVVLNSIKKIDTGAGTTNSVLLESIAITSIIKKASENSPYNIPATVMETNSTEDQSVKWNGETYRAINENEKTELYGEFEHISQSDAMYDEYKMGGNADCGPASLIMALYALNIAVPSTNKSTSEGEALVVMRDLMVDDPARDGVDEKHKNIVEAEHQGDKAFTNFYDIERGAERSGAKTERIVTDDLDSTIDAIKKSLNNGDKIVASGTFTGKDPLPWTGDRKLNEKAPGGAGDHIIAITNYDDITGNFTIHDPARRTPIEVNGDKLKSFMKGNFGAISIQK